MTLPDAPTTKFQQAPFFQMKLIATFFGIVIWPLLVRALVGTSSLPSLPIGKEQVCAFPIFQIGGRLPNCPTRSDRLSSRLMKKLCVALLALAALPHRAAPDCEALYNSPCAACH